MGLDWLSTEAIVRQPSIGNQPQGYERKHARDFQNRALRKERTCYATGGKAVACCVRCTVRNYTACQHAVSAGRSLAKRLKGRKDRHGMHGRVADAMQCLRSPRLHRRSLRTALLFLAGPATQKPAVCNERVVTGVKHASYRAPNGQRRS